MAVALPFNYVGESKREGKPSIYAFEGETTILRSEYHIGKQGPGLGNEVKITYAIEASPKK